MISKIYNGNDHGTDTNMLIVLQFLHVAYISCLCMLVLGIPIKVGQGEAKETQHVTFRWQSNWSHLFVVFHIHNIIQSHNSVMSDSQ